MDGQVQSTTYQTPAADTRSLDERIDRLEERIRRGTQNGSMTRSEAYNAQRALDALRRDEALLTDRVERLEQQVRATRQDRRDDRRY
jgi:hypothetical protein